MGVNFFKTAFWFIAAGLLVLMTFRITFVAISSLLGMPFGAECKFWLYYSCAGFAGALIYFALAKKLAKHRLKIKVISAQTKNANEQALLTCLHKLARNAQLEVPPELGLYQNDEINSFSTGTSRNNALIALSSAAYEKLTPANLEAMLAHEVAHIHSGDMATMTLLQGLLNALVLIPASLIADAVCALVEKPAQQAARTLTYFCTEIAVMFLGAMLICNYSREREFAADRKAAELVGHGSMLDALRRVQPTYGLVDDSHLGLMTLKFCGHSTGGWANFVATHPSPHDRILRLEKSVGLSPDERPVSTLWKT